MSYPEDPAEPVFRALADRTRRRLLDTLRERPGQNLGELCGQADMARQSVSQHLDVLAAANLVTTIRRGREKLHYLNPVPLHDIYERWIERFEQPRPQMLSRVKQRAEAHVMSEKPDFVYVTYIEASAAQVWEALTDPDLTAQYWGHRNVSDWQPGSRWEHQLDGADTLDAIGTVVEAEPPRRLVFTFEDAVEAPRTDPSRVTFDIETDGSIVRLTVTHENLANADQLRGISAGWPAVLANLKSLLETGHALPTAPWTMPSEPSAGR